MNVTRTSDKLYMQFTHPHPPPIQKSPPLCVHIHTCIHTHTRSPHTHTHTRPPHRAPAVTPLTSPPRPPLPSRLFRPEEFLCSSHTRNKRSARRPALPGRGPAWLVVYFPLPPGEAPESKGAAAPGTSPRAPPWASCSPPARSPALGSGGSGRPRTTWRRQHTLTLTHPPK